MSRHRSPFKAAREVRQFNARHPIGTPVRYWPGVRDGDGVRSHTRSEAQLLGGHTPVVLVEGRGDWIALTHVESWAGEGSTTLGELLEQLRERQREVRRG